MRPMVSRCILCSPCFIIALELFSSDTGMENFVSQPRNFYIYLDYFLQYITVLLIFHLYSTYGLLSGIILFSFPFYLRVMIGIMETVDSFETSFFPGSSLPDGVCCCPEFAYRKCIKQTHCLIDLPSL